MRNPTPAPPRRALTAVLLALATLGAGAPFAQDCVKRTLRDHAYAFKLRVKSTTGYFKVNVGTGATHGECPDHRVNFIGRRVLAGDPSAWKSVREEACFVVGDSGTTAELSMEWDVVVPFVPAEGHVLKVWPSGSTGNVEVTVLDMAGKESLRQSFSRSAGTLDAPPGKLPPPGGLRSVLPAKPALAPKFGAYLFPWYGLLEGPTRALVHWGEPDILYHPLGGRYDSGDPAAIDRQMAYARQARFNLLVLSYWDREGSNRNVAPTLVSAAKHGIEISAMIETVVRRPGVSPRDCFLAQLQEILRDHAVHPAWLKAEGRPVLFVYDRVVDEMKAASGAGWWQDWLWVKERLPGNPVVMVPITDSIAPDHVKAMGGGSVFAANSGAGSPWVGSHQEDWSWTWTAERGGGLSALPILPRFKRLGIPSDIPNYRNQWRAARASLPDIILVNSWNEYHESSVIEPTEEFGTDWLRLSAHEADLFCRGELGPLVPATETGIPVAGTRRVEMGPPARGGARRTAEGWELRGEGRDGWIAVRDLAGREVRRLPLRGGKALWDGRGAEGGRLPAGLYFAGPGAASPHILLGE